MGVIINLSALSKDMLKKTDMPVILCSLPNRSDKLIYEIQYTPLNLNIMLAEELLKHPVEQRTLKANDAVMSIISQCDTPTLFEEYEILFDPRYKIDALKVFEEIARRQKVVVKWRGRLNGNLLEYATIDYKDYHSFRIQDYDIICVK